MTPLSNAPLAARALCQQLATENKVKLLGPGRNARYAAFRHRDGREFELNVLGLQRHGWPSDLDKTLEQQGLLDAKWGPISMKRMAALAKKHGAKLLDTEWKGREASYSFQLKDGTHVQFRNVYLQVHGWPADPVRTANWAQHRRDAMRRDITPEELYAEFSASVEAYGARVVTPSWLGARTPHELQLSDGSRRWIQPNQLKNSGWPIDASEELQRLAGKGTIESLKKKSESGKRMFRVALPASMHLDGTFFELRRALNDGLLADVKQAVRWARKEGLSFVPGKWRGLVASYQFHSADGRQRRALPWVAQARAAERNVRLLAPLKRVATMNGLTLLSTEWAGESALYAFQRGDGSTFESTKAALIQEVQGTRALKRLQLAGLRIAPGYRLLSTVWAGSTAKYRWQTAAGFVVDATLRELEKFRELEAKIVAWSAQTGITIGESLPLQFGDHFTWRLPDGSHVMADWPVMHEAARIVLQRKAYLTAKSTSKLTARECQELVKAVVARQLA